jgi:hypothetical protein
MAEAKPRPIAFMVMPFRKRPIPNPPPGAPAEVDFDGLWDRALRPALETLGYIAVRADAETGTVILKDMLERLKFADLVLADTTLPNGNVYYELGIRHAAKDAGCVQIGAAWSKQLFDIEQVRAVPYPLVNGSIPEGEAAAISQVVCDAVQKFRDSKTPFYELVTTPEASSVFRDQLQAMSAFQAAVRTVRLEPVQERRRSRTRELLDQYRTSSSDLPDVAFELLKLVRDNLGWTDLRDFVQALPPALQKQAFPREQLILALSKLGDHASAIANLTELIKSEGGTPERWGLIGGRYKELWRSARGAASLQEESHLDNAIESYRTGMLLDLNAYYCVSNLPGLLRRRNAAGDMQEAEFLDKVAVMAAQRKIDRQEDDGWSKSTLLGAAFRLGNLAEIDRLIKEVAREGSAVWQLKSTLADIGDALELTIDGTLKAQLEIRRDKLKTLLPPPDPA